MELNDLNKVSRSSKLNKLLSTRFGFGFDLSKMNEDIANQMIKTAKREMAEETEGKKYMMSKVVLETVEAWQIENNLGVNEGPDTKEKGEIEPNDGKVEPEQESPAAQSRKANALRLLVGPQNYMKAKRALEMYKKGQTVPPTLMTGLMPIIDMIDEIMSSNLANVRFLQMVDKRAKKQLGIAESKQINEGEVESAELVLASKDLVDRIQSMLEDVSDMQAEDLLPLTDQIRDEMGNEKAEAFINAAKGSLDALYDALSTARGDMDNASRILTGNADESGTDLTTADDTEVEEPVADADADAEVNAVDDTLDVDLDADASGQEGVDDLDRQERP
jgi:hypothetical protein